MDIKDSLYSLYQKVQKIPSSHSKNAVVFYNGEETHKITYSELDIFVKQIVKELLALDASNEIIGCFCGPDPILPALLLGILEISSAFTIIDKDRPADYIQNIEKYLSLNTIIAKKSTLEASRWEFCACWTLMKSARVGLTNIIIFQKMGTDCCKHGQSTSLPQKKKCHEGLAYVIQTSGTTGCPKIVQVPHQCIVPNIKHFLTLFNVIPNDTIFLASALTFDPSVIEIFLALAAGASLLIVSEQIKLIPNVLSEVLLKFAVTLLQVTPSFVQLFEPNFLKNELLTGNSNLRILALGGERCPSIEKLCVLKDPENKTRFFNVYGLTEVSCWATCHELNFSLVSNSDVPLGTPLIGTEMQIQDELGHCMDEGFGQLFIGGSTRWCVVDGETWESTGKMRPTGDWVSRRKTGEIFFESRKDDVIKYHGRKFFISAVDRTIEKFSFIQRHVTVFNQVDLKLCIFVKLEPTPTLSREDVRSRVIKTLRSNLPNVPPLAVHFVPYIPITPHGKFDGKKLLKFSEQISSERLNNEFITTKESISHIVSSLWKDFTWANNIDATDNFVLSGGNSISALQFAMEVENKTTVLCPGLVNALLNSTYESVIQLLLGHLNGDRDFPVKKRKLVSDHGCLLLNESSEPKVHICHAEATKRGYRNLCFCERPTCGTEDSSVTKVLILEQCFKWDLKKCIDASPCVVNYSQNGGIICYIGSHSGIFSAVNVEKMDLLWQVQLPDRIESSACLSTCGCYVFVGCYDCHLYCFNCQTGDICWKVSTGAEIKSSPVASVDYVYVGCHDHMLYSVTIRGGGVSWKAEISDGSVFSSPALSSDCVCAATLDGVVASFNKDCGQLIWRYVYGKPFFSSPLFVDGSVFIGSVDGCLLNIDHNGILVTKYTTDGPLFSSAAHISISNESRIVIGSHDSKVHCCSLNGQYIWTFQCSSAVYSTPFPFGNNSNYIAVACTKGLIYILNAQDGSEVYKVDCPGEIFSSPVVINNYLVSGCRDNNVYIFKIREPE